MNKRLAAIHSDRRRTQQPGGSEQIKHSLQFGAQVFHRGLIEELLPKKIAKNWFDAMDGRGQFDPENADAIAEVLKDWALTQGATHYTHWFQPLTHSSAEKHDSFLSRDRAGLCLEQFRGKELLSGEPDASSLPSGGLRRTHQARGYTTWDLSFPFLWEGGNGVVLCIPSVFFSWKGAALDNKLPLLRSEEKLSAAVLRLLKLCNVPVSRVFSTLGVEQEYFCIDRDLFLLRPDLLLAGRTVFGAKPPKGQELEDHYFGSIKDRVMAFMREFEDLSIRLGIPLKTRHNEVAPAQHEVAPLFERASLAIDHNVLLMEVMRQTALKHGLACLLHEKPFKGINGSGKHNNWSLATDTGLNLLDPQENSLVFLTLLTAILRAVHEHAALLRASIGSAGNDHRLGGAEAPPTILSVYLGEMLEQWLERLVFDRKSEVRLQAIDLGLAALPRHLPDSSDRNRTSFFAFTGNKFEFRAVGSSVVSSWPVSVMHAIIADSLQLILDEIADVIGDRKLSEEQIFAESLPVLCKHLKIAWPVLFSGNNYSAEWEIEAAARGLPNIRKSFHAFSQILEKKSLRVFEGILSFDELHSRYEIFIEQYAKTMNIEANLMVELFRTEILPAASADQKNRAESLIALEKLNITPGAHQIEILKTLSTAIEAAIHDIAEVEKLQMQMEDFGWEAKGKVFADLGSAKMEQARKSVDFLETLVDDGLWPVPKYRELLFLI